jgi:hypothetical protein
MGKFLVWRERAIEPSECPECPECEKTNTKYLGRIPYGADFDTDSEWYDHCEFLSGWYCLDCGCQFVTDDR